MQGVQVAVVCPTTLLARQHATTFSERFSGYPVEIRQLSRLVSYAEATKTRAGLEDGSIDIVIGTHALLAKSVTFQRRGIGIVDEEQKFGVPNKARLHRPNADDHGRARTAPGPE